MLSYGTNDCNCLVHRACWTHRAREAGAHEPVERIKTVEPMCVEPVGPIGLAH